MRACSSTRALHQVLLVFSKEEVKTPRARRRHGTRGQWVEPWHLQAKERQGLPLAPSTGIWSLFCKKHSFRMSCITRKRKSFLFMLCSLNKRKNYFLPKKKKNPLWSSSLPAHTPRGQFLTPFLVFRDCVSVITSRFSHKSEVRILCFIVLWANLEIHPFNSL